VRTTCGFAFALLNRSLFAIRHSSFSNSVTKHSTIRILHDPSLNGPTNMARDEALMTRVGRSESPPTLRLYQWNPPTISLGYFQCYADYESLPAPAGELAVVRRLTGGGAILHDLELTYSLTLPADHRLVSNGPNRLYELAHDAVMACLGDLGLVATRCGTTDDSSPTRGPFFCFERRHRYDVLLEQTAVSCSAPSFHPPLPRGERGGSARHTKRENAIGQDKIAGSAQRRTREAVLQHGSIILGNRYTQQATATVPLPFDKSVQHVRSSFAEHLADVTGECFKHGDWSAAELASADTLVGKYADIEWTKRR